MEVLKRALELSHEYISHVLKEGDFAVDCTAGNGNDTCFMASLVGDTGKVYSIDIQKVAIDNTKDKLVEQNLIDRVELINDCHSNVDIYVCERIKCGMFNLGYLPSGDHNIVTKPNSTIYSIDKLLSLLIVGGIITIGIYYGHPGGDEEKDEILKFVSSLDQDFYAVQKIEFVNMINCPPILVIIERLA